MTECFNNQELNLTNIMSENFEKIPTHVAIIMDGNGRWALKQGDSERIFGHEAGAIHIADIVIRAGELGIKYMTFFTFSTENWNRPKPEIDFILSDLLVRYLEKETPIMMEHNIRFSAIGDLSALPENTQEALAKVIEKTAGNTGVKGTLALNYGGRQEILKAVKRFAQESEGDESKIKELSIDNFRNYLNDPEIPDPDILIRTGGEMRISNFFLWQLSYTELIVSETLWPDFGPDDLNKAVEEFNNRERRFGGLGE